jgi:hypothetical protein
LLPTEESLLRRPNSVVEPSLSHDAEA